VTAAAIAETVRVATAGDYDVNLPKLNLSERQVPIRVKLPDSVRADLAAIGRLTVQGRSGPVLLANVADIGIDSGPCADRPAQPQPQRHLRDRACTGVSFGEVYAESRKLPGAAAAAASGRHHRRQGMRRECRPCSPASAWR
jgi:multidrug efflux pump subunit AcrB